MASSAVSGPNMPLKRPGMRGPLEAAAAKGTRRAKGWPAPCNCDLFAGLDPDEEAGEIGLGLVDVDHGGAGSRVGG